MVAAEHRQRHEDLPRVRDAIPRTEIPRCSAIAASRSRSGPRAVISSAASGTDTAFPCSARTSARRRACVVAAATAEATTLCAREDRRARGRCRCRKFLRGLVRAAPDADLTAVVNTGDDIDVHGLRVCPHLDSVTYWLGDAFDRGRGWGRRDESFRATEELRTFDPDAAWFGLGDLDLATHLFRTRSLADGMSLSGVTARIATRFGIDATIMPMSEDRVETRLDVVADGREMDLHFQEYWVKRDARDDVKAIRFEGAERASPAPGVLDATGTADVVAIRLESGRLDRSDPGRPRCALAVAGRPVVGVSPIVGGRPLAGWPTG